MATYLSLEEAAKQLGIPTEKLIDLRSQGQVRGFRDGSSWKFPDTEIARLKDELPNLSGLGSGILAADDGGSKIGPVIGADDDSALSLGDPIGDGSGSGSGSGIDLDLELPKNAGDSDVNLVPAASDSEHDVTIVPESKIDPPSSGGSSIMDLDAMKLSGSALLHDQNELDLAADVPKDGSSIARPLDLANDPIKESDEFNLGSSLDVGNDSVDMALDLGDTPDEVASGSGSSGDALAGNESDLDLDLGLASGDQAASSLELMDDLDLRDSASSVGGQGALAGGSVGGDVLSELDLLSGESGGSGLLSGDSDNLLGSSLMGPDSGGSSGVDDALADDDDLIIADDDDDLVVSGAGSDISIAGDSGINLMSPSDSGLSLESEPLDLAGSSVSALDLGAELNEGSGGLGSGSGSGLVPDDGMGSAVDFQADEEFQLSPSGIQLEGGEDSASQVIDIEESDAVSGVDVDLAGSSGIGSSIGSGAGSGIGSDGGFSGEVAFEDADIADGEFADVGGLDDPGVLEGEPAEAGMIGMDEGGIDTSAVAAPAGAVAVPTGYQVPFTLLQTVGMLMILSVMCLGGMLMTDLVRNMWSYAEPSAPVSSLTDMLIDVAGWGQ